MDRGVRAIVSHRLPNAEELNAGCGDWLECCQAYIHARSCAEAPAAKPTNEHREQAQEIVQQWCAEMIDSMKDGECMQLPPGSLTSLTNRIAAALSRAGEEPERLE